MSVAKFLARFARPASPEPAPPKVCSEVPIVIFAVGDRVTIGDEPPGEVEEITEDGWVKWNNGTGCTHFTRPDFLLKLGPF